MEEAIGRSPAEKRIAVVTGGNKGIGLEICRQLALNGVKVILTARDEKRGMAAVEKLRDSGVSDVVFHQLDVTDSSSIASLAHFIGVQFGKLDILVNNAGVAGVAIDLEKLSEFLKASKSTNEEKVEDTDGVRNWMKENFQRTYEMAEECMKTNYHGVKNVTEALLPHLQSSYFGTIVNVSSTLGQLQCIPNEGLRQELNNIDGLSEDRLTDLSNLFLKDFKEGLLDANNWPTFLSAYTVSKVLVNCYTRILAKRYPSLCINCNSPGFVKTDINYNTGILTTEEGAKGPVMLALLPKGSSSGLFYDQTKISPF
uniref:Salutaridine reductase isoform X1 n=1 Tax=Elaeis guineensis var. tenera TaxID=51953 RepID=A0A6I9R2J1_ELAGV|nr:salutaridine reductase isoform X1 [Elaeis guineensis]